MPCLPLDSDENTLLHNCISGYYLQLAQSRKNLKKSIQDRIQDTLQDNTEIIEALHRQYARIQTKMDTMLELQYKLMNLSEYGACNTCNHNHNKTN